MGVISVGTGAQLSVINTEHNLITNTTIGIFVLTIDVSAMVLGDSVEIRLKTTCRPGDPEKVAYLETLTDVQQDQNWHSIPIPLASSDSISCTLRQITGSPRTFPWNLRRM